MLSIYTILVCRRIFIRFNLLLISSFGRKKIDLLKIIRYTSYNFD